MNDVVYRIVEHDGGWAYTLDGSFSETFPSRRDAEFAAERAAEEQRSPGEDEAISWEDEAGVWHDEAARGSDRPNATVARDAPAAGPARPAAPRAVRTATRVAGDYALGAYDRGDQYARRGMRVARTQVRSDPLTTMLVAIACGFALGLIFRRKS